MSSGGKGEADVSYEQSPQQRALYEALMPMLTGEGGLFSGGFQAPQYGQPTADWYSGLSPDIMAGLQQPYIEAQKQGMELLGGQGGVGSARGGASGTAGAMTGEIMGQMATQVPLQAWQMGAPGRAAEYQAGMMPYTGAIGALGSTMPEAIVDPGGGGGMGMMGGALGGGMMGSMLGLSNPYTAAMMLGGGLLGGK